MGESHTLSDVLTNKKKEIQSGFARNGSVPISTHMLVKPQNDMSEETRDAIVNKIAQRQETKPATVAKKRNKKEKT